MRRLLPAMASLLFLSGCTTVKYVPCPVMPPYSKEDQAQLKKEVQEHPSATVIRVINDYIGVRDQIRVCAEPTDR